MIRSQSFEAGMVVAVLVVACAAACASAATRPFDGADASSTADGASARDAGSADAVHGALDGAAVDASALPPDGAASCGTGSGTPRVAPCTTPEVYVLGERAVEVQARFPLRAECAVVESVELTLAGETVTIPSGRAATADVRSVFARGGPPAASVAALCRTSGLREAPIRMTVRGRTEEGPWIMNCDPATHPAIVLCEDEPVAESPPAATLSVQITRGPGGGTRSHLSVLAVLDGTRVLDATPGPTRLLVSSMGTSDRIVTMHRSISGDSRRAVMNLVATDDVFGDAVCPTDPARATPPTTVTVPVPTSGDSTFELEVYVHSCSRITL